ncbi:SH3 domain-containing protein [Rufibacter sp. LB8]|uniref:SH3 domain-containing protein n=1 Tax=Rufibacter sp. LB8 TaxID=2777781 RepID=UPI00178C4986|nr:SH3 domain-containing protein [Rufibacter sp. LB8]
MKRIILLSAMLLMQVMFVFAQEPATHVNTNKVGMYRQPDAKGEVMRLLNVEDEIKVVRKLNSDWSLVQIDGEGGYVLNAYLKARKGKKATAAKAAADASRASL